MRPLRAVLLDIEGTTTSVRFVYDTLFPYARAHVEAFLGAHWDSPEVQADVERFRSQAEADRAEDLDGAVAIPAGDAARGAVVASVRWQMDHDRKTTALKSLQGKIWRAGYASGELKADVFGDVPGALQAWREAGVPVYIYSSGSVEAQKLLFAHTHHGDLTPLLSGYCDTTSGPKQQAGSYTAIAEAIGVSPSGVLFVTDVVAEALAAREAGMRAVIMDRPGNRAQPEHDFEVWTAFP